MKNKFSQLPQLNAGTGMLGGIVAGALIALIVNLITGDSIIWSWAIPVGLACGLAIGAGRNSKTSKEDAS